MTTAILTSDLSKAGRRRLLGHVGEPLLLAAWERSVFIHYEADPSVLQRQVPFALDLRDGRAFVSIVAFNLWRMRPRFGGRFGERFFKPIASHEFLNVRTYVQHNGEPGIFFLAEWLSNRLSVELGPRSFGLPYRFGRIFYDHANREHIMSGTVKADDGLLRYRSRPSSENFHASEAGSLTEFLLERYTAFTFHRRRRLFRVWHEPWEQTPIEVDVSANDLLASTGAWWESAELIGANYSPGVEVWMGRPHRITETNSSGRHIPAKVNHRAEKFEHQQNREELGENSEDELDRHIAVDLERVERRGFEAGREAIPVSEKDRAREPAPPSPQTRPRPHDPAEKNGNEQIRHVPFRQ